MNNPFENRTGYGGFDPCRDRTKDCPKCHVPPQEYNYGKLGEKFGMPPGVTIWACPECGHKKGN